MAVAYVDPIDDDEWDDDIDFETRIVPDVEWLTRAEAADFLGTSEDGVRGLERHGHLQVGVHYFRPTPRLLRYRRSALERWLTTPARSEPEQQTEITEEELLVELREHARRLTGGKR